MAIVTQERHNERLVVIPVVAFEILATSAPRTSWGTFQEAELLGQRCRVPGGTCSQSPRTIGVEAQIQGTAETGELRGEALASKFLHVVWSAGENQIGYPERDETTAVSTPSAEPLRGHPTESLC